MPKEGMICLSILAGVVLETLWRHRFDIWCWYQGQKVARRLYPDARDSTRRHLFAKRWATNLYALRTSIVNGHRSK